jgi:hypothetical protein
MNLVCHLGGTLFAVACSNRGRSRAKILRISVDHFDVFDLTSTPAYYNIPALQVPFRCLDVSRYSHATLTDLCSISHALDLEVSV